MDEPNCNDCPYREPLTDAPDSCLYLATFDYRGRSGDGGDYGEYCALPLDLAPDTCGESRDLIMS